MIKNIVFDYGRVLVVWDPHRLYDPFFGDRAKADWFLKNICDAGWLNEIDGGKPFGQAIDELCAKYPEWTKEIRVFKDRWKDMMGGHVPGMLEFVKELKACGIGLYGLTNWGSESFSQARLEYEVFSLMDGMVVSGEEFITKPDPRIFKILFDRYDLIPEECIFIDDKLENVQAGESLGMRGIVFTDEPSLRREICRIMEQEGICFTNAPLSCGR